MRTGTETTLRPSPECSGNLRAPLPKSTKRALCRGRRRRKLVHGRECCRMGLNELSAPLASERPIYPTMFSTTRGICFSRKWGPPVTAAICPTDQLGDSDLPVPAVYIDFHARDVRRILGGQKRHDGCHFLGLSEPLHRNSRNHILREFIEGFF